MAGCGEGLATTVFDPLVLALEPDAAMAFQQFHRFRRGGTEIEGRRQDHADRFAGAVRQHHRVADALAVEIDIGFLEHRHLIELHAHQSVSTMSKSALERSEEHTSELQSLMRISYAVFCLKTQKTYTSLQSIVTKRHNN